MSCEKECGIQGMFRDVCNFERRKEGNENFCFIESSIEEERKFLIVHVPNIAYLISIARDCLKQDELTDRFNKGEFNQPLQNP